MAFVKEEPKWEPGIYQLEEQDPVMGGEDGIDNRPNKELANRTLYLKIELEKLAEIVGNGVDLSAHDNDVNAHAAAFEKHNTDPLAHKNISAMPVGGIMAYPSADLPEGFMACDGTYLNRTAYKDLFAIIGTTYGAGDGINTFNLPDLRGYFVRGLDDGKGVDPNRKLGSVQGDAIRNITGDTGIIETVGTQFTGAFRLDTSRTKYGESSSQATLNPVVFDASCVVPTADENRPKNIALVYAIKVFGAATNQGAVDIGELAESVAELTNTLQQPAGSVLAYAGKQPPSGYLAANGAAVGRATYPDLFAAIGTIYGAGDGATTFNLPDLRGEFLRGADAGRGVDVGREVGSAQVDELKSHGHNTTIYRFGAGSSNNNSNYGSNDISKPIYTENTGGTETRPRNVAILYCIKAFGSKTNVGQIDLTALANEVAGNRLSSVWLYPNGGTAAAPANVTINSRYVMDNPWPGYFVKCLAQIQVNGEWGETGIGNNVGTGHYSAFAVSSQLGNSIVLQCGNNGVTSTNNLTGNPSPSVSTVIISAPCRIYCEKGGKLPS